MTLLRSILTAVATMIVPCAAAAAPINFDCDVPANKYSSVSQETEAALAVSGVVKLIEARSGTYLPVAGARLVSSDGEVSAGIQLVVEGGRNSSNFNAVLNLNRGEGLKRYAVAQIAKDDSVSFSLASEGDKILLTIGDKKVAMDFVPMAGGTISIFCSTAQFKFTDVTFSASAPRR